VQSSPEPRPRHPPPASRPLRRSGAAPGRGTRGRASLAALLALLAPLALTAALPGRAGAQQCEITIGNLEFGSYSSSAPAPEEAAGRISVRCDGPAAVNVEVSLDSGEHGGGFAPRQMRHAARGDRLGYLIFTDAGMTTVWGDGSRGSATVRRRVGAVAVEIPVYGRIPAGQDVGAGRFVDRVTVHVDW